MIAPERVGGGEILDRFAAEGYRLWLADGEVRATGPAPPGEELRALAAENRDAFRAAVLCADPPPWLATLFDYYWRGVETPVKLTGTSGKTEVFMVSVSIKNICAAVAAEIGMPVLEWERIRPEVEEALGSWGGAA